MRNRKNKDSLELKVCKCGRIHFYKFSMLYELLEDEKELILICSNCGDVIHIGSDKRKEMVDIKDLSVKYIHEMYSYKIESETITELNFNKEKMNEEQKRTIGKILISSGKPVYMETGFYADSMVDSNFCDSSSQFPYFNEKYDSVEQILSGLIKYNEKRKKVVMHVFIKSLTDEEAKTLSGYLFKNLDWKGTKYERKL